MLALIDAELPADTADHPDLFTWAGVPLPHHAPAPPDRTALVIYRPAGTPFVVYENRRLQPARPAGDEAVDEQAVLPFPPDGAPRLIPPRASAFMNATVLGFFHESQRRQAAAAHLAMQGVLYLGDLAQMTQYEMILRLGRYADLTDAFISEMAGVRLGLEAAAPWWRRPHDYYRRAP